MNKLIDIESASEIVRFECGSWKGLAREIIKQFKSLPSADQCADEWCTDCKEYDSKKHCCPRFKRVIKQTVQKTGKWEPIESEVWGYTAVYGYKCSCCGGSANTDSLFLLSKYCPNCGARMVNDADSD